MGEGIHRNNHGIILCDYIAYRVFGYSDMWRGEQQYYMHHHDMT